MTLQCQRCGHSTPITNGVGNTMHRCSRCGTPHSCPAGVALGPLVLPITAATSRVGIWLPACYEPLVDGVYECSFTTGEHLRLRWHAGAWTWCAKLVDVSALLKWRGRWSDT